MDSCLEVVCKVPRAVAVIPAYNEEQTLGAVINVTKQVAEIDQVIVISDGSTDKTAQVARAYGATVIELEQNLGKGGAMKVGIDSADAEIFVFLDADLIGLRPDHVKALLKPVLEDRADMVIGVFDRGRVATDLAQVVAPYLSGQRAVKRSVLQGVSGMELARFGVEIALTRHLRKSDTRVIEVTLENLTHRMKEEKLGLLRGFMARMKMYWEILKYTQGS
jgi:glycosyltransferase involved in cell wall biosynthesis